MERKWYFLTYFSGQTLVPSSRGQAVQEAGADRLSGNVDEKLPFFFFFFFLLFFFFFLFLFFRFFFFFFL